MQEQQKTTSKQTPNPIKYIDPGEIFQARQPRCPLSLGNGRHQLQNSRSSRRRLLCSYLVASTPMIFKHSPKFPERKKLTDCLLSGLFSSTNTTGTDDSRPYQPVLITQSKWRTSVLHMAANDASGGFNFLTALSISMKLGTRVHHA